MATTNALFDIEEEEETNNFRYFDIPYAPNDSKQSRSTILNAPLSRIEETIKPLGHLIDDIATKVYFIKKAVSAIPMELEM